MSGLRHLMSIARAANTAANDDIILIADVDDFTTIAKPATPESNTITSDHVFPTGKGFSRLEPSYKTLKTKKGFSEQPDSSGRLITWEFFKPGETSATELDADALKMGRFIALKRNPDNPAQWIQLGHDAFDYAFVRNANYEDGEVLGTKGHTMILEAHMKKTIFYTGEISYKPAP
jgi:hypothetical protein